MITNNKPLEILRSFHQQHATILSLQTAFPYLTFSACTLRSSSTRFMAISLVTGIFGMVLAFLMFTEYTIWPLKVPLAKKAKKTNLNLKSRHSYTVSKITQYLFINFKLRFSSMIPVHKVGPQPELELKTHENRVQTLPWACSGHIT